MRIYFRSIASIFFVACFIVSCTTAPTNPAVWLGPATTIGDSNPKVVSAGQTVDVMGEVSPDSSSTKIRFDGVDGWLSTKFLFRNATLGVVREQTGVTYTTNGGEASIDLYPFEFAVLGESNSGFTNARVVRGQTVYECSIPDGSITTNEDDVEFLKKFFAAYSSTSKSQETVSGIVSLIKSGAASNLVLPRDYCFMWQAKLDEVPEGELGNFMDKHGIYLDKSTGAAAAVSFVMETQLRTAIRNLLKNDDENDVYYDNLPGPRNVWLNQVIYNLPSYVAYKPAYNNNDESMRMLSFLAYRVDRSPENLKAIWDKYKDFFYGVVSTNTWKSRYLEFNARLLVEAHTHLSTNGTLASVAEASKKVEGKSWAEQMDVYAPFMLPAISESIAYESNLTDPDYYSMWIHSFWARREREGNAAVVAEILKEAIAHYDNAPEESGEQAEVDFGDERGDAEDGSDYDQSEGEGDYEGDENEYMGPFIPPMELPAVGTRVTYTCSYLGYASGDCAHYYFTCDNGLNGDFGDAELSPEMSAADRELWYELSSNGNGQYVFDVEVIQGKQCQGMDQSDWPDGPVPKLLTFKKAQ